MRLFGINDYVKRIKNVENAKQYWNSKKIVISLLQL